MKHRTVFDIMVLAFPLAIYVVALNQWTRLSRYPTFLIVLLVLASLVALAAYLVSRRRVYCLIPALVAFILGVVAILDLSISLSGMLWFSLPFAGLLAPSLYWFITRRSRPRRPIRLFALSIAALQFGLSLAVILGARDAGRLAMPCSPS